MEFFDTHSHYNDEKFDGDRKKIIEETFKEQVTKFVCAGYNIKSSKQAIELSEEYENIYAVCGISPNDVTQNVTEDVEELEKILDNKKISAIGEIGLDYYWEKGNKELQKELFIKQIELANKLELPIQIHTRDAAIDTIDILKSNPVKKKGIFHCCPLNKELVKEALKLDFYISFAGPITFKNCKNADEIIKMVPLERILIETDSPYLSPEPNRGKRNDSRNVRYIAEKVAKVKGKTIQEIAKITYQNAEQIFNIGGE
ncbi:MAG: TatD family hydrolase [Clostridia bacterium]|nr:TatD family hydrolase [Clostridia bacterium]